MGEWIMGAIIGDYTLLSTRETKGTTLLKADLGTLKF